MKMYYEDAFMHKFVYYGRWWLSSGWDKSNNRYSYYSPVVDDIVFSSRPVER